MLMTLAVTTSCVDDDELEFAFERPASLAGYEYLADYDALKTYVDRSATPNFKLGGALAASDYNARGLVTRLANMNFDEVVTGNDMKMASVVNEKGDMDFGTVETFVQNATDNGLSIYGHTLAWHAQQPVMWLKTLIANKPVPVAPDEGGETEEVIEEQLTNPDCEGADATNFICRDGDGSGDVNRIEDGVGVDGSHGVRVHAVADAAEDWSTQFFIYTPDHVWKAGDKYEFKMKARADKPASISVQSHTSPGNYIHWSMLGGNYDLTTDWQDITFTGEISSDQAGANGMQSIAFNLNVLREDNDYYFDDMSWKAYVQKTKEASGPAVVQVDLITNGDMEGDETKNFVSKEAAGDVVNSTITAGVGKDGTRGIKVTSPAGAAEDWDTQFWIVFDDPLPADTKMHVAFDYKASRDASADTQAHYNPGEYQHWECAGSPSFTTDWQRWERDVTVSGDMAGANGLKSIAFNLSKDKDNTVDFFFDNIKVTIEQEIDTSDGIPQTAEELRDTLTYAMDKWISGMMNACKSEDGVVLVKAWDVVNEAISGEDSDGDGIYDLQHRNIKPKDLKKNDDFCWQDYMGDLAYVRTAVRLARQYGGDDLKLFINDYNLESDWDQNKKLKSLIKWIEKWEEDGTRIDGIGSQMHISFYANAQTQESKKNAIVNSFKLLAETGKLVRVSELDMGYVDEEGNSVKTVNMTEEQHHQMAEFYTWIIQQYKEIIPAAQQWGICQWCITDSPTNSGWRAGEPVGLWDLNYNRKHTYAGFVNGLSGK